MILFREISGIVTHTKNDYLMPTFREVDVFQKVGNVALAYPKLPSFPEIVSHVFSNERVGIHSLFSPLPPPLLFDKYDLQLGIYL